MCGIYGIWNRDGKPLDVRLVQRATTVIRHRGPDDEGYLLINTHTGNLVHCGGDDTADGVDIPHISQYFGEHFDLALGFRRLAILDLSPEGHQPMHSNDGRYWMIFNGEVYNYIELREELRGYGYEFRSGSDTEVIVNAYHRWGEDCLSRFNGMWMFAIWDTQARNLFIARDRFGIKPMYFVNQGDFFSFASEPKALIGQHGIPFEPDDEVIFSYLAYEQLPDARSGRTFFKGVTPLTPGNYLCVSGESLQQKRYYDIAYHYAEGKPKTEQQAVEEFRELLIDAVRLRLRADVAIGTCLSGGLDSSSITGAISHLMQTEHGIHASQIGAHQKTFSAVYHENGAFNERTHIDKVIQKHQVDANFVYPSAEGLVNDLDKLIWHQDEPFTTTSIFAQWCVMRLARERGMTVMLDGQGADEILGGYIPEPYRYYLNEFRLSGNYWGLLREVARIRDVTQGQYTGLEYFQSALVNKARSKIGVTNQIADAHPILKHDFVATHAPNVDVTPEILSHIPPSQRRLSDYTYWAISQTLNQLLRYEDRNSMAFSIEARVPFLDYRLVEFTFNHGAPFRMHKGWSKWMLRQATTDLLPQEIAWRRDKVGFATPEHSWQKVVGEAVKERFTPDSRMRNYVNIEAVRPRLGVENASLSDVRQQWRWVNLEGWLRQWD